MGIITEAVTAEGPIRVDRLFRAVIKHSAGGRLNRKMSTSLEEALQAAEKGGLVIIQPPTSGSLLSESFVISPDTVVKARRRGRRKVSEIPPAEVMAAY